MGENPRENDGGDTDEVNADVKEAQVGKSNTGLKLAMVDWAKAAAFEHHEERMAGRWVVVGVWGGGVCRGGCGCGCGGGCGGEWWCLCGGGSGGGGCDDCVLVVVEASGGQDDCVLVVVVEASVGQDDCDHDVQVGKQLEVSTGQATHTDQVNIEDI